MRRFDEYRAARWGGLRFTVLSEEPYNSKGSRIEISVYKDKDLFTGEEKPTEINWPSFGSTDLLFARSFFNTLSEAVELARVLETGWRPTVRTVEEIEAEFRAEKEVS